MAIPAPAGPPVPYWPTVVVKPETVRGVQTYYVNLILDIIFGVFALIIGLSSIVVATATDLPAAIAFAAVFGAAACGLIIVFVINFIVSLMSVLRMHHGADEYGPEHAVNARRGVVFKWIGTTLSTLAAILVVYLLIAGSAVFIGGSSVPATVYVPLLITVFWTAGVSSKAQMYRFMVRSLQPPETPSRVAPLAPRVRARGEDPDRDTGQHDERRERRGKREIRPGGGHVVGGFGPLGRPLEGPRKGT